MIYLKRHSFHLFIFIGFFQLLSGRLWIRWLLEKGLKEFEKVTKDSKTIDGITAFHLFDTYGFPIELTIELAQEQGITVDKQGYLDKSRK